MQWMRVHDQRQRRARFLAMMVTTFEPAVRAGKHDLRHNVLFIPYPGRGMTRVNPSHDIPPHHARRGWDFC
jgi:hypothetical protein